MNRTKRRLGRKGILLIVALMALLAVGCGGKKEPVKTSEVETSVPVETGIRAESGTATQELPNPTAEVKDVLAFEVIGAYMVLPEGAEDTGFSIINQEVADARLSLDGVAYTYRASDTAEDFVGIFERLKGEAISRNYDYGETSLEVLIKTTDSGGRPAPWEWGGTKYTLYTAAQVDDDTITDLIMYLVELSQYEKQSKRGQYMLELKNFVPINFLKEEKFTGSHNGMRFRMERLDLEGGDGPCLGITIWPEPYGYDTIPEEEKEQQILSFDADGIAKGVDWLNKQFEDQKARWKAVSRS